MATPRWDWATVAVGRGQEDPGGLVHVVVYHSTSDVQGQLVQCWEAKPGVPAFASRNRQLFSHFLRRPMPYFVGLKLQRPRHIRRYSPGRIDGRRIKRFWHDMNTARRILINV